MTGLELRLVPPETSERTATLTREDNKVYVGISSSKFGGAAKVKSRAADMRFAESLPYQWGFTVGESSARYAWR